MTNPITSSDNQIYALKHVKNVGVKLQIARTTQDVDVMKVVLDKGSTREIIHLAKNTNLPDDIVQAIIDKDINLATKALVSRRENE